MFLYLFWVSFNCLIIQSILICLLDFCFSYRFFDCKLILQQNYQIYNINKPQSQLKMKANFDINLPSIPGKNIRFKIQDVNTAAFWTQKARFNDNKALLTKNFVQSFQNFHESKRNDEIETQPQTQLSNSFVSQRRQMVFRPIISQNKKYLLPVYAKLKKQQNAKISNSLAPLQKSKGFSFSKAGLGSPQNEQQMQIYQETQSDYKLTDNYYFTNQNNFNETQENNKKPRPSAVFKTETRKRVYDRIYNSVVPGPGTYIKDKVQQKIKSKVKKSRNSKQEAFKDKDLKQIITKIILEQNQALEQEQQIDKKQLKQDHMFVVDDRDRFGDHIFPIAPKLKVPGPGSYDRNDSLEDKAKKVLLIEQQKKLLKQWFNN